MDEYWEKVVENVLGGYVDSPGSGDCSGLNSSPDGFTRVTKYERGGSKRRSRRRRKSYSSDDEISNVIRRTRNTSIECKRDQNLDSSLASIPKIIMRPQHNLGSTWTFWYSVGNKNLSWEQNQMKISTVSTVEQFWFLTSQLKHPSSIPVGHTYSVFRTGILPDWEDKNNCDGGRWMMTFSRKDRDEIFDVKWQELLVLMVGEHFPHAESVINGAEACIRKKGDRLEVWLCDASGMIDVIEVGRSIKEKLADSCKNVRFSLHKEDKDGIKGPRLSL